MAEHFKDFSVEHNGVSVYIPFAVFNKRFERAQEWLGQKVLEDNRVYMPYKTGALIARSFTKNGGRKVVFPGPYARFLYMGKVMVGEHSGSPWARAGEKKIVTDRDLHYSDPLACAFWSVKAKDEHRHEWIEGVRKILKGK